MATREERIVALAQAMGADVKALNLTTGDLSALNTTAKDSLVNSINELFSMAGSSIDDTATDGDTDKAWSANKVHDEIVTAVNTLRSQLTNGASAALDTLKELADAMGNDANFANTIAAGLAKRVRVDDAQTFTVAEKLQGCNNLGLGNPDADFVAVYTAAKA